MFLRKLTTSLFHKPKNPEIYLAIFGGLVLTLSLIFLIPNPKPNVDSTPTQTPTLEPSILSSDSTSTPIPSILPSPTSILASQTFQQILNDIHQTNPNPTSIPTPTPKSSSKPVTIITAFGTQTTKNKTSSYSLAFPKEGGVLTGSITGYCQGEIYGIFDVNTSQTSGTLTGTCLYQGYSVQSEGSFSGTIDLKTNQASGNWQGKAGGISTADTWSFTFVE